MAFSWQQLHDIEAHYGDSFYILDSNQFQNNYHEFIGAFRQIYPHSNIAYSYKTNYIPRIGQHVQRLGGYAEVVSRMEYDLARRIGVPPDRIIFNGPYKSPDDLELALCAGSIVNLDSLREATLAVEVMHRYSDRKMLVGLRCNLDIGNNTISRFGFNIEDEGEELNTVFQLLTSVENCVIGGFHCHFSASDKSPASYAMRTKRLLALSATYFKGQPPKFINLGGGYFSKMSPELRKQFTITIATYQEYAEAIATPVAAMFPSATGPELIMEPGSALTADVMQFVAKVIDLRHIRGRSIALVSGSIHNIKPTLHTKNMPMQVVSSNDSAQAGGVIDIVGYTCMEHDCLHTGYEGALSAGDFVCFPNVGAYTVVMKPPFIRPMPAILAYDANSAVVEVIKQRETGADVFATYVF